jgi:hypothetical protein
MSLINEALKKAQRQRSDQPPGTVPVGDRVEYRRQGMGTQTLILIGAGAAVLIVCSVVLTVFLVNRPSSTPAPTAAATLASTTSSKAGTPATDLNAPSPVIVAPVIPKPVPAATESPESTISTPATSVAVAEPKTAETKPVAEPSASGVSTVAVPVAPATTVATVAAPNPVAPAATPASTSPAPGEKPTQEQIQTFVDGIRVAGIRSSGGGSKVLMNDRVYRVNDVVNRTMGLKLLKVEPEQLTCADAAGVIYVKTF